jgi:membrane protease YdiL (CAAX protease family)
VSETPTEEQRGTSGLRLGIWLGLIGTLIALNYAGRYLIEAPEEDMRDALYEWTTFFGALIQFGFLFAVTLALTWGLPTRQVLGLRRPRSWWKSLGLAVAVFIGVYIVAAIVGVLGADPGEEQGLTPEGWDSSRAAPFLANAVLVAVFVPIVEELMFRGLGFSLLVPYGVATAIVGTALLFALGHGVVFGIPIFVFMGLGLAFIRHRMDSVYPTILMHACFNAIALVLAVTVGGDS